jgi:hypothetical protein
LAIVVRPPHISVVLPRDATAAVRTQSDINQTNLAAISAVPAVDRGPLWTRIWPAPSGVSLLTWVDQLKLLLIGKDRFFGLAGNPNFDWPVPKGPIPGIDLKTWLHTLTPNLAGKDQFFGLAGNPNFDWPNPRGYDQGAISNRSWNIGFRLLAQTQPEPTNQYDWPNPQGYAPGALENRTLIGQNILPIELTAQTIFRKPLIVNPRGPVPCIDLLTWAFSSPLAITGQKLPVGGNRNFDWPVPRGSFWPTDAFLTKNFALNQDTFFGLAGNPNYDWPNPPGYAPGVITNKTWVQGLIPDLVSKDVFFGLAGNPNFDWPVPRGPVPAIDLKTWLLGFRSVIEPTAPPPPENYDWPNPSGYPQGAITNKTWLQTLLPYELNKDTFFGLAGNPNFDWPVPRGPVPVIDLKTWLQGFSDVGSPPPPPSNFDWPVPKGPDTSGRDWIVQNLALGSGDTFFGLAGNPNFDWPNPPGYPIGTITNRTWIELGNIVSAPGKPFFNYDLPNPRGPGGIIDLITWINESLNFRVQLPPPPINYDWPNPRVGPSVIWAYWTYFRGLSLTDKFFGLAGNPNFDWPVPKGPVPVIDLRTTISGFRIQSQPLLHPPPTNYDWPVPKGQVGVIDLLTALNTLALILPPGPPPPPPAPTQLPGGGHRKPKKGPGSQPIWDRKPEAPEQAPPLPPKKVELPPSFLGKTLHPIKSVVAAPPSFADVGYANPTKIAAKIDAAREEQDRQDAMAAILAIMKNNK